jgi:phosphoglycolate phosphatase-like HAD superfamily hydrolase
MKEYDALFFDFDGVLVDSVEVKARAFARLFEPHGADTVARVIEFHRRNGGMPRAEKFRYYYEHLLKKPLTQEISEELCRRFSLLVVDEVVAAPAISGAEDLLKSCRGRIPCFVISATPEEELKDIIARRGWTDYFEAVLGAPLKKQEHVQILLRDRSYDSKKCVFFGDAEADYIAAKNCGVPFIGIVPGPEAPLLKAVPGVRWAINFEIILPTAGRFK